MEVEKSRAVNGAGEMVDIVFAELDADGNETGNYRYEFHDPVPVVPLSREPQPTEPTAIDAEADAEPAVVPTPAPEPIVVERIVRVVEYVAAPPNDDLPAHEVRNAGIYQMIGGTLAVLAVVLMVAVSLAIR